MKNLYPYTAYYLSHGVIYPLAVFAFDLEDVKNRVVETQGKTKDKIKKIELGHTLNRKELAQAMTVFSEDI